MPKYVDFPSDYRAWRPIYFRTLWDSLRIKSQM
jgi:hypothetical protein